MKARTVVVQPLSDNDGSNVAESELEQTVTYNSYVTAQKDSVSPKTISTKKLYNCCSLILEDHETVVLTHYDDNVVYLESLLDGCMKKPCNAYVIGGETQHVYELLSTLRDCSVTLRGGYIDYYSGEDIDPLNSKPDDIFYDLLHSYVDIYGSQNVIANDIYGLSVTSWKNARKDVRLHLDSDEIVVSVSADQYRQYILENLNTL
jgi:hypothetical protein